MMKAEAEKTIGAKGAQRAETAPEQAASGMSRRARHAALYKAAQEEARSAGEAEATALSAEAPRQAKPSPRVRDDAGAMEAEGRPAKRSGGAAPAKGKTASGKKRSKKKRRSRAKRVTGRIGLSVATFIALVLVAALGAGYVGFKGPSQNLGDLLTVTMLETSALKFVPRIYYSKAEVEAVLDRNKTEEIEDITDASMIVIAKPTPLPTPQPDAGDEPAEATDITAVEAPTVESLLAPGTAAPENLMVSEDGIEIYEVSGSTFTGWMMVIQDPSRVSVGVCRENFNSSGGYRLDELAKKYDAVAAINGGGFSDPNGTGNGGMPAGVVISNGKVLHKANTSSEYSIVMGFNQDNVLIVGKMTADECVKKGIRDALAFGPALVVNGKAAKIKGASSGLNPRTAIGQRADGAVLMLVVDGRQASSLGATYADIIAVLLEYGAVNAANLDGGSSSMMYYKGDYINKGVLLTGSRRLPTCFIVR